MDMTLSEILEGIREMWAVIDKICWSNQIGIWRGFLHIFTWSVYTGARLFGKTSIKEAAGSPSTAAAVVVVYPTTSHRDDDDGRGIWSMPRKLAGGQHDQPRNISNTSWLHHIITSPLTGSRAASSRWWGSWRQNVQRVYMYIKTSYKHIWSAHCKNATVFMISYRIIQLLSARCCSVLE
jgi:hypothetical protein